MFFKDIPGQEDIKNYLRTAVRAGKLPHALLFAGEAGRGTLPLVRALIAYQTCLQRTEEDSCGQCEACQKTHKLGHPDVHFTFPTVGSKLGSADLMEHWRDLLMMNPFADIQDWMMQADAEKGNLNINAKELQAMLQFSSLKSYQGKEKVLVVWFAEFLDTEGNRLLKLIEEPPEGMYIYLVTEDRSRILNTIQSRCQSLVIKPLLDDEMAAYLRKHKGVEEEMAAKMAFIADGDMNQALKLLDAGNDDLFLEFILWMRVCYKLAPKELMDKVSQYQNWTKQQLKNFLEVGLNALEQILLAGTLNQTQLRLSEEAQKPILNLAKLLELDQIFEIKELIEQSIRSVERNANRKILIARQSLMIHRVIHRAPELESRKLPF